MSSKIYLQKGLTSNLRRFTVTLEQVTKRKTVKVYRDNRTSQIIVRVGVIMFWFTVALVAATCFWIQALDSLEAEDRNRMQRQREQETRLVLTVDSVRKLNKTEECRIIGDQLICQFFQMGARKFSTSGATK